MEEKMVCPKCGSNLCVPVVNAVRCQQCGFQFAEVRNPISADAERRRREGVRGWKRADTKT
jgi:hypothetical protein